MSRNLHLAAGILAPLCVATFFVSTLIGELLGSPQAVATLKSLIVTPGLWILVPAMAAVGGSGFVRAKARGGRLVDAKRRRMPFIAANGLLVLVPCAIVLDRWAAAGSLDSRFYLLQAVELLAGAANLTLMLLNLRDGLRLTANAHAAAAPMGMPR
ncbi:hypothetical protein CKO44_10360 [Rubrivivax gelatinosus]|uniref:hypothetical protein n=1 Tax=Rubrivivax gelatinosus TaxID=28068 RepID=UPI001904732D|nr:hypothetical protein [Rubrivivax gelatinosus]MBK1613871.1 hypothetical protein [Rubrivivax gelatinosus]